MLVSVCSCDVDAGAYFSPCSKFPLPWSVDFARLCDVEVGGNGQSLLLALNLIHQSFFILMALVMWMHVLIVNP